MASPYNFNDSNIKWQRLGDAEHLLYSILNIDEENHIVHALFKYDANEQIVLHRHLIHNNTLVLQSELRLYEPDGTLKEIRPTGMYKSIPAGDVHREGGGPDQDAVVFFDMRGHDGVFYEILDEDQNVVAALGYAEFLGVYKAQQAEAAK
jgi:quercetin dioxygenase-like cupin family protein